MSAATQQVMGEFEYVGAVTPLATRVEFMRYCPNCEEARIFLAGWECDSGLLGYCIGCGREDVEPFHRVNSGRV